MRDVQDLYRNTIVDHYKSPRNFRGIENANRQAEGRNALCGDMFRISMYINNKRIQDIGFTGSGCAIATASASMMTEFLKGKTESEARKSYRDFIDFLSGKGNTEPPSFLGDLSVFSGVREYPARKKCAAFAWNIFLEALEGSPKHAATD